MHCRRFWFLICWVFCLQSGKAAPKGYLFKTVLTQTEQTESDHSALLQLPFFKRTVLDVSKIQNSGKVTSIGVRGRPFVVLANHSVKDVEKIFRNFNHSVEDIQAHLYDPGGFLFGISGSPPRMARQYYWMVLGRERVPAAVFCIYSNEKPHRLIAVQMAIGVEEKWKSPDVTEKAQFRRIQYTSENRPIKWSLPDAISLENLVHQGALLEVLSNNQISDPKIMKKLKLDLEKSAVAESAVFGLNTVHRYRFTPEWDILIRSLKGQGSKFYLVPFRPVAYAAAVADSAKWHTVAFGPAMVK